MQFDPDAYLQKKSQSTGFDPDAYLAQKAAPVSVADQPLNENNVSQPGVDTQPLYPATAQDVAQPTTRTQRPYKISLSRLKN